MTAQRPPLIKRTLRGMVQCWLQGHDVLAALGRNQHTICPRCGGFVRGRMKEKSWEKVR
jgi:hypothetical protein